MQSRQRPKQGAPRAGSSRARAPRRPRGGERPGGTLNALAARFVSLPVVGALLALAGVVAVLAPLTHMPTTMNRGWWVEAMHLPQTAATLAALSFSGLLVGAFLWWTRGVRTLVERPDGVIPESSLAALEEKYSGRSYRSAWVGVLLMSAGVALAMGHWLAMHQTAPAGRISLALNQSTEFYRAPMAAKSLKVTLPLRMTVTGAVFGEDPLVHVRFASPKKQDEAGSIPMRPGKSLDVENLRFTFIGFTSAKSSLRATIKGSEANTIEVAAGIGDTVRVAIDGTVFEVTDMTPNYMQALGPAVELHSPEHDAFWLFARASSEGQGKGLDFGHGLELVDIESVPAPVFAVAPHRTTWPLGAGGGLFVLGLLAFFLVPQRRLVRFSGPQGESLTGVLSLNEAGGLVDELRSVEEERS